MHGQGVAIGILLAGTISCASAQWLNYRDPKTPRTKDGKPNLSAPAPRSQGKPDLAGVWQTEPSPPEEMARLFPELGVLFLLGDDPRTFSKYPRRRAHGCASQPDLLRLRNIGGATRRDCPSYCMASWTGS